MLILAFGATTLAGYQIVDVPRMAAENDEITFG
jgi:hypothetical protein